MVNLLERNEQTGRSMVEMLGVLAIIGVLSVGGIAGYSKAMTKFKITKTMDQVSMMVANIRTLYSGQRNYSGLATGNALDMGVVPAEMEGADSAVGANTLVNAFQGAVTIGTVNYNQQTASAFRVSYENMGQEACVQLITSSELPVAKDVTDRASSGFIGIQVSDAAPQGQNAPAFGNAAVKGAAAWDNMHLPVTPADAATTCATDDGYTTITWYYM